MKKLITGALVIISIMTILSGYIGMRKGMVRTMNLDAQNAIKISNGSDIGNGTIDLLTQTIDVNDNKLEFIPSNFDESKTTFIYVANKKVFEGKLKNNVNFSVDINNISNAHKSNYKPKVQFIQFIQYANDTKKKNIETFKQVRYACK